MIAELSDIQRIGTKCCGRCKITRSHSEFGPNRARKDGLTVYCRGCTREYMQERGYDKKRWQEKREHESARSRAYRERNIDEMRRKWREAAAAARAANPAQKRAWNAARKHGEKRATPPWAELAAMNAVYAAARRLQEADGIERHVDHVIPLKHPLVCGLHVLANLRILTATENMSKKNKFQVQ